MALPATPTACPIGFVKTEAALGTAEASNFLSVDANKDFTGVRNGTLTGEVAAASAAITGAISCASAVVGSGTLKVVKVTVDASAGGSAQETAICTVPEDSLILDVSAKVVVGFDGDTTTDFEVGTNANPDKYIDTADFEPETHNLTLSMYGSTTSDTALPSLVDAAEAIVATWTNTANMTAGSIEVIVTYLELDLTAD